MSQLTSHHNTPPPQVQGQAPHGLTLPSIATLEAHNWEVDGMDLVPEGHTATTSAYLPDSTGLDVDEDSDVEATDGTSIHHHTTWLLQEAAGPFSIAGHTIMPYPIAGYTVELLSQSAAGTSVATAGNNNYSYNFDTSNIPVFQSSAVPLEMLLEDDQPSVNGYNEVQDVCEFFDRWAMSSYTIPGSISIGTEATQTRNWQRPPIVRANELQGDRFDIQGIDWTKLHTTRTEARRARAAFYSTEPRKVRARTQSKRPASRESYFRFRQMNSAIHPFICHFQLRNLITATSQSDVFYAGRFHVCHTDGQRVRNVMDLTPASTTWPLPRALSITCLSSSSDVLVVGGFAGEYALKNLGSEMEAPIHQGFLTHDSNGITNHVHTFNHRHSNQTQVAFCSNDKRLRLLDCYTNTITSTFAYPEAINCSTTSPDGRLRVLVGDGRSAFLTNAESGQPLAKFSVHTDDIFACTWSPDGLLLATAAQDSEVVIFDARRWDRPLAALPTSLSCARSLRFSPAGSGKRLLYVAEANDFVTVVDATTFETCQTLDFFGAIGGIALTPEGDSLYVANCDPNFGGLIQYEALPAYGNGVTAEPFEKVYSAAGASSRGGWGRKLDWFSERELAMEDPSKHERRYRRGLGLEDLMI